MCVCVCVCKYVLTFIVCSIYELTIYVYLCVCVCIYIYIYTQVTSYYPYTDSLNTKTIRYFVRIKFCARSHTTLTQKLLDVLEYFAHYK